MVWSGVEWGDWTVEWSGVHGVECGGVEWSGVEWVDAPAAATAVAAAAADQEEAGSSGTRHGGGGSAGGEGGHSGIRMLVPAAQRWGRDAQIEI